MNAARYYIAAMDCPTEEQIIRNGLKSDTQVVELQFDLLQRILTVGLTPEGNPNSVKATLDKLGMAAHILGENVNQPDKSEEAATRKRERQRRLLMAASGIAAAVAEIVGWATGGDASPMVIVLSVISILLGGQDTFRKALTALRTMTLNINFLMSLAVFGAVCVGQWPEAAMVTFLFGLAERIEAASLDRARDAIRSLLQTSP